MARDLRASRPARAAPAPRRNVSRRGPTDRRAGRPRNAPDAQCYPHDRYERAGRCGALARSGSLGSGSKGAWISLRTMTATRFEAQAADRSRILVDSQARVIESITFV